MEGLTFSYRQELYDEETEGFRRILRWRNEIKTFTYENCTASVIGMDGDLVRVVMRRKKAISSKFMKSKKKFTLTLMMGFVVKKVIPPKEEAINGQKTWSISFEIESPQDKYIRNISDVKIWITAKDQPIDGSAIEVLFKEIQQKKGKPPTDPHLFSSDIEPNNEVIPVIYQPEVDAWKNFLREVHVHKKNSSYEVTLVFNDERLRANSFWDSIYRGLRKLLYQRIKDVETFCIHSGDNLTHFTFPNIYSGDYTMYYDNIHEDKEKPPQVRTIKYYYQDRNHPIVFINTSNHAMAPHDNNHDFWKWEYVPWSDEVPIVQGKKSRKEVDDSFKLIKF